MQREAFYPRGLSQAGFLGAGEVLEEVLEHDHAIVKQLGYDCQRIGLVLKRVLDGRGPAKFDIRQQQWLGFQSCPFPGCLYYLNPGQSRYQMCKYAASDFWLKNKRTGHEISVPGLVWHLIVDHGFFEGLKSPYRIDPRQLINVLFDGAADRLSKGI